jgi:peptidoglycan/LPS O-acetylase OafA/YrhL
MIKYRPEIDGLRALAVLPVVLFHAGFQSFSGGFVGVDVFFVISGYLITSLILADVAKGGFSFARFYERRARRILPALFLVIICTIPFVWFLYLPADMKDFTESVAAIPLFLSNFVFESQSGYFERATDIKPLIHTWSLAVEEQFYLFFPILLLLILRFHKSKGFMLILLLSILSLALAEWGVHNAPTDAYFLLPTRIWEMLLGSLMAMYLIDRDNRRISDIACAIGIVMILVSVFYYDQTTPFPGLTALLPTVGTCLFILYAGPKTVTYALFSNRFIVLLGLISYSLYLWHQPIFAIVKYQSHDELSIAVRIAMITASIILAFVSWKYIEAPWRNPSKTSKKSVVIWGVGVSCFFLAFGIIGTVKDGDLGRFNQQTLAIANPVSGVGCPTRKIADGMCLIGATDQTASIVVIGDSHVGALTKSLDQSFRKVGVSAHLYTAGWCPPFADVNVSNDNDQKCANIRGTAIQDALNDENIKTVILHAEWANYTTGTRWGRRSERFISDAFSNTLNIAENQQVFERGLARTITLLNDAGKHVVIVKSVPEYNVNVPNHLATHFAKTGVLDQANIRVSKVEYNHRNAGVKAAFASVVQTDVVSFVDPYPLFCPSDQCQMFDKSHQVLYTDGNHLSLIGGNSLSKLIVDVLKK